MTHAALGILVGDGALDPADPAPVPEWAGTEKESITVLDLLEMRSGLQFVEDYVDGETSDVIEMLFGAGARGPRRLRRRAAAVAPARHGVELLVGHDEHPVPDPRRPRRRRRATPAEREAATRAFLDQRLFGPAGMPDADPRFDDVGTFGRLVLRPRPGAAVRPLRRAVPARRDRRRRAACCPRAGSTTPAR